MSQSRREFLGAASAAGLAACIPLAGASAGSRADIAESATPLTDSFPKLRYRERRNAAVGEALFGHNRKFIPLGRTQPGIPIFAGSHMASCRRGSTSRSPEHGIG